MPRKMRMVAKLFTCWHAYYQYTTANVKYLYTVVNKKVTLLLFT